MAYTKASMIDAICEKKAMRVLPRNDGSIKRINAILDTSKAIRCKEILDNGFFFEPAETGRYTGIEPGKYIAWNITTDQLQMNKNLQQQDAAANCSLTCLMNLFAGESSSPLMARAMLQRDSPSTCTGKAMRQLALAFTPMSAPSPWE